MADGIGSSGVRGDAYAAAMRNFEAAAARIQSLQQGAAPGVPTSFPDPRAAAGGSPATSQALAGVQGAQSAHDASSELGRGLQDGLRGIAEQMRGLEQMPEKLLTGEVDSMHEMAARIKSADLSFRFALEVRNKLIDAYREVMRMSV